MLYKINRDFYRVMSRNGKYIKRSRNVRLVGFSAAALLAIYLLLAVFPICYKDKDAEATVVPSTTTLSIVSSKDTASVEITPTSGAGTFATSVAADKAEFTVTTDNLTGYSLNLVGSDTSGQLVNATTGDTLDTLTADVSETTFRTGAAETYANKWGYQLNVNSTTTTNFLAAPTTGTKTIYTTTGPNTSADSYTLGVGARVDYSKAEGTYTNTFVLTAVGNPISYQINYLDNTGEGGTTGEDVSDLPTAEGSANITASSFTLATGTPSRTGYNFVGWCYGTVDHTTDPSTCDGTTYQPGDTFTFTSIPSTGTATANLYAMWETDNTITMQDLTPSQCTTTPTAFKDKRDGEEYIVAKLADGNCWMLDNLRLDPTAVTLDKLKGNTNATDQILTYFKNGGGSSPYPSSGVVAKTASGGSWTDSYNLPFVATSGTDNGGWTKDTVASTKYGSGSGKIGVYYNYCAASAGSYCYASGSGSGNAQYDICPSGWKMPTGDTAKGSYYYLFNSGYSGNKTATNTGSLQYNLSTPLSGLFSSGSASSQGSYGYFWSSTYRNGNDMYNLNVGASSVLPQDFNTRNLGFSVRCILKQTMQNFTDAEASAMAVYETKQLEDARDGQKYDIVKLTNGDVWMAKNLAIGCAGSNFSAKNLTPEDSNVNNNNYTTSTTSLTSGNSYDSPRQTCSSSYGAWYNYAAATAGTITGSLNTDDAIYDICPKGWHLPTNNEMSGIISNWNEIDAFNPAYGGYYENGSLRDASDGKFWTATATGSDTGRLIKSWTRNTNGLASTGSSRSDGLYVRCIKNMRSMQSFTTDDADAMAVGETRTLKDARDGKKYTVAKLADGNVWMTENLNLAGGTALSADDTDVTSTYINGFTTGGNLTKNTTNNTISLPASSTSGFNDNSNAFVYNTSNTSCGSNNPCYGYYSWIAATLGGKQADGSTAETRDGYNAAASICPKGWKLPTATTSNASATNNSNWQTGDFYKLATQYGLATGPYYENPDNAPTFYSQAGPGTLPNFLLTGIYNSSGSFYEGGSYGSYWSSSSFSSTNAHNLAFGSTHVYSANNDTRRYGLAVRCMLSDERTLDDITYLQDMNSGIASRTATGTMKTLIDKRDNQEYTVQKLADGRVWMMDNLNLGAIDLTQDLTSENTNCATSGSTACVATSMSGNSTLTAANFNSYEKTSGSGTYTAPEYIPVSGNDTTMGEPGVPYGTLYNYCAASAGTICNSSNSLNASYDLCPAGWRLPTAGSSSEFQTLYGLSAYNTNAKMRTSYTSGGAAFALSGYFTTGVPVAKDGQTFYWSSTYGYSTDMKVLSVSDSIINTNHTNGRIIGNPIRCIAK